MNDEPLAHDIKAQALVMLCCHLPRSTSVGVLEDMAEALVADIQDEWKRQRRPDPTRADASRDEASGDDHVNDSTPPWKK